MAGVQRTLKCEALGPGVSWVLLPSGPCVRIRAALGPGGQTQVSVAFPRAGAGGALEATEEAAGPSTHTAQLRVRGSQLKPCSRIAPDTAEHRTDKHTNKRYSKKEPQLDRSDADGVSHGQRIVSLILRMIL